MWTQLGLPTHARIQPTLAKVKTKDKLGQRMKEWFKTSRCLTGHNKHEKPSDAHQWGGTGITLTDNLTVRSTGDANVNKLGRWLPTENKE